MEKVRLSFLVLGLVFAASLALSCGGSSLTRQLQSLTLSPAMADAQSSPSGQVRFTATGNYNTAPRTVSPLTATWGACLQGSPTSEVTVSSQGVAQCATGASGTYSIFAFDMPSGVNCDAITACGGGCTITGTAQLTCP